MPEILYCQQGEPEWHEARLGIPTASKFATVMAKGEGKVRMKYMRQLAAERITGVPTDGYSNHHFERGKEMEPEARDLYAFAHDLECEQVGFIRNNALKAGCSPDSLIGSDGMLEIKTTLGDLLIEMIEADKFPAAHVAQCQGNLWIAEREWIDLLVYWPGMPPFEKRAYRDKKYILNLEDEVARFNNELDALTERVRRYGAPEVVPHRQMMKQLQEAPKWAS